MTRVRSLSRVAAAALVLGGVAAGAVAPVPAQAADSCDQRTAPVLSLIHI